MGNVVSIIVIIAESIVTGSMAVPQRFPIILGFWSLRPVRVLYGHG